MRARTWTWPTSARAPAPSSTTCAPRRRCCAGTRWRKGIRLIVAPASIQDQEQAREEGVLQVLLDAGAELFPTACGACSGYGDPMGDDITVISTTARNFKGRMGSPSAQVYLGSPYTVAAAALRGQVTDPREVLA
jgi:3-isopropylmalate/(R)-2-methylmalate dehydratase large subunit